MCLTQENKNRPWILFEAGALAKGLSTARVCTFLIDLEPKDIEDPLAQFNHTLPNRDSVLGLVRTLNGTLGQDALDVRVLEQVFNTYWPQFDKRFKEILGETKPAEPSKPRPKEDVLAEILENTRTLASKVRRLESDRHVALRRELELDKFRADEKKLGQRWATLRQLTKTNEATMLDILKRFEEQDPINKDSNGSNE